jgi:uncharacterized membrane protein YgdD (TMEM256/DUF423 family)
MTAPITEYHRQNHKDVEMDRLFMIVGALFAFIGVAAGAFGAHALKPRLPSDLFDIFEVGVRYQMIHALGLLAVAWAITRWPFRPVEVAGWLFIAGIVIFSGSLYLLSLTGVRWLGAITPIGGVAFLAGWALMIWGIWKG